MLKLADIATRSPFCMKNITVRIKQAHFACQNWLAQGQDRLPCMKKYNSPDYASTFCMLKLADIGDKINTLYEKYNSPDYASTFCILKLADIGTRSTLCMKNMTVRLCKHILHAKTG